MNCASGPILLTPLSPIAYFDGSTGAYAPADHHRLHVNGVRDKPCWGRKSVHDWVTITAAQPLDMLHGMVDGRLRPVLLRHGITMNIEGRELHGNAVLHCRFFNLTSPDAGRKCRRELASVLSDIIIEILEPGIVNKVVQRAYSDLDPQEKERICRQVISQLAGTAASTQPARRHKSRWEYISGRLEDYLNHNDMIHLEGFINFRLPDYLEELEEAVDKAVDDMLIEREYREFMRFLRSIVETQHPKIDTVHVLIDCGKAFSLVDGTGNAIHVDELDQLLHVQSGPNLEMDDILISALIGISPRQIMLHDPMARCSVETADALQTVFDRRVRLCPGCKLCERRRQME